MGDDTLSRVKRALLIPESEGYADDEISIHIASCRRLLMTAGIPEGTAGSDDDPLVLALVLIYVKTNFGFKGDGSARELPKTFDLLLRQLCLHCAGSGEGGGA